MKTTEQHFQHYEPIPSEAHHLNDMLIVIGQDLVFVAEETTAGLEYLNANPLDRAQQRMSTMNARIEQASAEAFTLKSTYGV
jgi:hypothetical protein